jgi:hypothetical protein
MYMWITIQIEGARPNGQIVCRWKNEVRKKYINLIRKRVSKDQRGIFVEHKE